MPPKGVAAVGRVVTPDGGRIETRLRPTDLDTPLRGYSISALGFLFLVAVVDGQVING